MSTHTPGPWRVDERAAGGYPLVYQDADVNEETGPIARVFPTKCRDANARLIAAAPRMLDALRRIANETCDHGAGFCPRDEARAILREIEGQRPDVEGESNG